MDLGEGSRREGENYYLLGTHSVLGTIVGNIRR